MSSMDERFGSAHSRNGGLCGNVNVNVVIG